MAKIQKIIPILPLLVGVCLSATAQNGKTPAKAIVKVGAQRSELWLPKVEGQSVALVANQTSMVNDEHLVDFMIRSKVNLVKVFAPEHGFRGDHGAGERITSGRDEKTGLPVVSLYGKHKKPSSTDLADVDIVLFDIQDVGARFYTYISTMHYVMEACAEQDKKFIVLDRPNPNGHYVDGPILEYSFKSFIGMHPVPIVHGMTVGEYAKMINGERWLTNQVQVDLEVVECLNYDHTVFYELPVRPSPNLPNMTSVYLYPSLCLFEGTVLSVGRGTEVPFQVFGHPKMEGTYQFTPKSIPGVSANPKFKGEECTGYNLQKFSDLYIKNSKELYLFWLLESYKELGDQTDFFRSSFNRLAGTDKLKSQVMDGVPEKDIRATWKDGIDKFKEIRKKYLLYKDFE